MTELIDHVKMRLRDYPGYESEPEAIYALQKWSVDAGNWEPEKAASALIETIQARRCGVWGSWSYDAFQSVGVGQ
jgi:hypothetical protein